MVNDTVARLDKFTTKWEYQEDMPYAAYFQHRYDNVLISSFRIEDFDRDGDEDLLCWLFSNINGNEWTAIYLNDQQQQKLVQLYDHAGHTHIWDAPEYNPATRIISCEQYGSAYGHSSESSYRLNGLSAMPIEMQEQYRNAQTTSDAYYTGKDGKWLQDSLIVNVQMLDLKYHTDESDYLLYDLEQKGDGILKLSKYKSDWESEVTYQESIDFPDWADDMYITEMHPIPGFKIIDFNQDDAEDLIFYTGVDVHGSTQAIIFLHDRSTKTLIKLQNTAEGSDLWDTPEYNPKTKTITCRRISGNAGLSFTSTYKLKGFTARPLTKEVKDHTNVNGETGKGYSESTYTGKNSKWVLQSTVTDE